MATVPTITLNNGVEIPQLGFGVYQVKPEETAQAVQTALDQHGKRPTAVLKDLGVLGANVLLSHALGLDESEVACLARTDTKVVMVPTAAVKGGNGIGATGMFPEMLGRGVTIGLGTDAANNSNLVETLRAMYLAAVLFKDGHRDVRMVPAEQALEMATIGGARALGLGDEIGSLEPGKQADLVVWDVPSHEEIPYWLGADLVRAVVKRGRVVYARDSG